MEMLTVCDLPTNELAARFKATSGLATECRKRPQPYLRHHSLLMECAVNAVFEKSDKGVRQARERAERKERAAREEKEREARAKLAREAEESERRRRKAGASDAAANYQTLLSESVKDPNAPWHEWKQRLARDPQVRPFEPRSCQTHVPNTTYYCGH